MSTQRSLYPAVGGIRNGNGHRNGGGGDGHPRRRHGARAVWPDTAMAHAFLSALVRWAMAHRDDEAAKVVLPVGILTLAELVQVLRALAAARNAVRQ
jgi:hypothetical protein